MKKRAIYPTGLNRAGSITSDIAREDHELLQSAVREAGALALGYFGRDIKKWDKTPGDPVSEADLAVDALLKDRLCGARPGYGWMSEETEDDPARLSAALVWIYAPAT